MFSSFYNTADENEEAHVVAWDTLRGQVNMQHTHAHTVHALYFQAKLDGSTLNIFHVCVCVCVCVCARARERERER